MHVWAKFYDCKLKGSRDILVPSLHIWPITIARGAHNFFSEYQEMVFGMHPTHSPTSNLMKVTQFHKGDSTYNTQLLKHSIFCSTFSLNQTAAACPRSVWISLKRNVALLILRSSPVCAIFDIPLVMQKRCSDTSDVIHPWLWALG